MKFLRQEKISPEFVLAVIRDQYRQQLQYDPETEPDIDLEFSTVVSQWRMACDLLGWKGLGQALGDEWDIKVNNDQWKALLEPAGERTLGDVCEFIAANTNRRRDVIQPISPLGLPCPATSAFLAIRHYLSKAGVDVSELRPSSLLKPYTCKYPEIFLGPIAKLKPEKLPLIEINTPLQNIFTGLVILGIFLIIIGGVLALLIKPFGLFMPFLGVAMIGCGILGVFFTSRFRPKVNFTGVTTFRELVYKLIES